MDVVLQGLERILDFIKLILVVVGADKRRRESCPNVLFGIDFYKV